MEDICIVKNLLIEEAYMYSLNLKDTSFLVLMHVKYRKYLRFKFQGKLFQFTCLPFGLSTISYTYTKIMKLVMYKLRSMGILSITYLDNLLFIQKSYNNYLYSVNKAIILLKHLGFTIKLFK